MSNPQTLNHPWMLAVWPGMGNVASMAGYYLLSKLGMRRLAEVPAGDLFDVTHVEIQDGLIRTAPLPRNQFFVWTDPGGRHDLILFIGEAQPPRGKHAFCQRLLEFAREQRVERLFTFAAMGTPMNLRNHARVFGAATDSGTLQELRDVEIEILLSGQIGGLNGILLGVAAEQHVHGACLLGEMPHVFAKFPFPKASLAVLQRFIRLAGVDVDLTELSEQARAADIHLADVIARIERSRGNRFPPPAAAEESAVPGQSLRPEDEARIEALFRLAVQDRAKAYELKRELDRLGVFDRYEDRFLDLFRG